MTESLKSRVESSRQLHFNNRVSLMVMSCKIVVESINCESLPEDESFEPLARHR